MPDGTTTTAIDNLYVSGATGLVSQQIVDPAGASPLVTRTGYEAPGSGRFMRPTTRRLPADVAEGDTATQTSSEYYPGAGSSCAQAAPNRAGALRLRTGPDPGAGAVRQSTQYDYDASGRVVGTRRNSETHPDTTPAWSCTAYDTRGRVTSVAVPAFGGEAARTVAYEYAVVEAGKRNPLVATVTDTVGQTVTTITTRVDMAGRPQRYTDAWGNETNYTYDGAGRLTDTAGTVLRPAGGSRHVTYDKGQVKTQGLDLATLATATYDPATGELASVAYGNGTALASILRDGAGRTTRLTWTGLGGGALASDEVARSRTGRVVDERIDGADPHPGSGAFGTPASFNFRYDPAGRLRIGFVDGHDLAYDFADSGGCGSLATAGRNTNRSAVTDNATTTAYCYGPDDRLSSTSPATVSLGYDSRASVITLDAQTLGYDGSDRHTRTRVGGNDVVTYARDATGRIIGRTEAGQTANRYGHAGPGDSPSFLTNDDDAVVQRLVPVLGGVTVTVAIPGLAQTWSYPNVHGDVMAIANEAGAKQGTTLSYDPYGKALNNVPDTTRGSFDYGWLGSHQRPLEHAAGLTPVIEMGARPYLPSVGRFLSRDPVEGGSANDYGLSSTKWGA